MVTKDLPILPGSRLTIFYRDASSALLQLVNQWLNFTYSRSHAFRYERKNTNSTLVRIELATSALAGVQVTYYRCFRASIQGNTRGLVSSTSQPRCFRLPVSRYYLPMSISHDSGFLTLVFLFHITLNPIKPFFHCEDRTVRSTYRLALILTNETSIDRNVNVVSSLTASSTPSFSSNHGSLPPVALIFAKSLTLPLYSFRVLSPVAPVANTSVSLATWASSFPCPSCVLPVWLGVTFEFSSVHSDF